jgi:hypothetical protein
MLPTLEQFSITTPVFIRKIDKPSHWEPQGCNNSLEDRAKKVSERIFKNIVSSLWKVTLDEQFYGIIASLSANRLRQDQEISFIWVTQEELKEVNIEIQPKPEGKCLYVKDLHFNIQINSSSAQKLCHVLFEKDRKAERCKKDNIQNILNYQQSKNCKAINGTLLDCSCQTP